MKGTEIICTAQDVLYNFMQALESLEEGAGSALSTLRRGVLSSYHNFSIIHRQRVRLLWCITMGVEETAVAIRKLGIYLFRMDAVDRA